MAALPPLPPPPGAEDDGAPIEPAPEPRPSRWPIVVALLVVLAVGGGAALVMSWVLGGPNQCESGTFESDRFGYCAQVPPGWSAAAASPDDAADRFLQPAAAGTILITAVPVSRDQDLERFASYVRSIDADAGATVGQVDAIAVAGVDALTFDAASGPEDGAIRSREVVFVREGFAWRVQLADTPAGFDASSRALDELLAGWVFL